MFQNRHRGETILSRCFCQGNSDGRQSNQVSKQMMKYSEI
jgi:hypothetical protein